MQIDRLEENDWARLAKIRVEALRDAPHAFGTRAQEAEAWPEAKWREQLRTLATFVAVVDGRDVGIVRGVKHHRLDDATYLISMWVDPRARRQGVGAALIERVVQWAGRLGRRRVFLDVRAGNRAAECLYRAHGFAPTGVTQEDEGALEHEFVRTV